MTTHTTTKTSAATAGQLALDFTAAPSLPTPPPQARPLDEGTPDAEGSDDRAPRERRADAARARLAAGLAGLRDDRAALAGYLAFCARFRDYSPRNRLLVYLQRPAARFCKGYRDWQKHGRQVRKGERSIAILAPLLRRPTADEVAGGADPDRRVPFGFRAVGVFDYEQTDAVGDDALVYAPPVAWLDADGPEGLVARLEAAVASVGYAVETVDTGYADGRCRFDARVIEVRPGLSGADRAAVLAHELAHAVAHGPDAPGLDAEGDGTDGETGDGRRPSRASAELQAEGAAFVALAALGLDTARASLPYLRDWAGGDDDALAAELAAVDRVAGRLLALVDGADPDAA